MAQAADQATITATPSGIRWCSRGVGCVLFEDAKTKKVYIVEGMTVKGGKGAWARYNLMFARRTFVISLNAGGQGVHYAEGIRWDVSTKMWVPVPKPPSYLEIEYYTRFDERTVRLVEYVWDPVLCEWYEFSTRPSQILYRKVGDDEWKCFDCHSEKIPCVCSSVLDLRQMLMGYPQHILGNICSNCSRTHTTSMCLVCDGDYTPASLEGKEPFCPICHQSHDLDECVAVQSCCDHAFHEDCIERRRVQKNSCPVCRKDYPPISMDNGNSDDGNSDDGNSNDGNSNYDPRDDCSDCGNPNCPCQFYNRWQHS